MSARESGDGYDHHRGTAPLLRRTSRSRAGVFLVVNLAGFGAISAFWQYLGTGRWMDFAPASYYRGLVSPLGQTLLRPLNVLSHPWMILVAGLTLAAIILVPIATAVLYRLMFAAIFVALAAVVAHAPVLALALAAGCVVAARTPLRSDMPFLAVILGLLPVGLYLYLFGFTGSRSAEVLPLQRWVLSGPLLIAAVVAALLAAAVLALAKVTRFRPGVIWPALALLLGGSLGIFHTQLGPDELAYALIAERVAGGDVLFQPAKLASWCRQHDAEGLSRQRLKDKLEDNLKLRQRELITSCQGFLEPYGESRRAVEVLWIEAQCRSLQLDVPAFAAGTVRYTASFPLPGSEGVWQRIRSEWPGTSQAALAEWRLGELALRRGNLNAADEYLHAASENLANFLTTLKTPPEAEIESRVFLPAESIPARAYYAEALFWTRRLIWLMARNDALNDAATAQALAALADENPYQADYDERLGKLVGRHENTKLGDNLKLAFAMATGDPYEQAYQLIYLAEDERTDAAVEANYQLGMLAMQTARARALPLIAKLKEPQKYFQIVIAAPPNPWQELSREHLGRIKP